MPHPIASVPASSPPLEVPQPQDTVPAASMPHPVVASVAASSPSAGVSQQGLAPDTTTVRPHLSQEQHKVLHDYVMSLNPLTPAPNMHHPSVHRAPADTTTSYHLEEKNTPPGYVRTDVPNPGDVTYMRCEMVRRENHLAERSDAQEGAAPTLEDPETHASPTPSTLNSRREEPNAAAAYDPEVPATDAQTHQAVPPLSVHPPSESPATLPQQTLSQRAKRNPMTLVRSILQRQERHDDAPGQGGSAGP